MIKYKIGNITTNVDIRMFRDGTVNVNINTGSQQPNTGSCNITVDVQFGDPNLTGYTANDMLMALAQTVDALECQYPTAYLHLRMPYMPYARQDRPCSHGEAFSLRLAAKMINGMGFKTVSVLDPHSNVTTGVLDRMYAGTQFDVFKNIKPSFGDTYIVAPDAGAMKKAEEFARKVGAAGVITCSKKRNMKTQEIEGLRILDEVPVGAKILVLDDICDGGRSFIEVAKEMRSHSISTIELAATHGLFTYGVDCVADHFDMIYTTNSYFIDNDKHPKLKVVDIW